MKVYLVKHLGTGNYSCGGCEPIWVEKKEKGKRWKHIAHAKAHIREFVGHFWHYNRDMVKNIKLVIEEYEVCEVSTSDIQVEFEEGEKPHTPAIIYKQIIYYNTLPK